jgi:7,8-dihydro-6-hydroxymethylpterin-pyrophosphokinase
MFVVDQDKFINGVCEVSPASLLAVCRPSRLHRPELSSFPYFRLSPNHMTAIDLCQVETTLEPLVLLDELQDIENALGRKKIVDKGPRNIDLDILLYDDQVIDHERLRVPHPGMFEREFVLRPLAE